MKPIERAAKVYEQEACARTFSADLELHLLNGFVFSTPDFFIMGRPVPVVNEHDVEGHRQVVDPAYVFPREVCNAWMVFLHAGDMAKAWGILPYHLPFLAFERRNDLRYYDTATIRRLSGIAP